VQKLTVAAGALWPMGVNIIWIIPDFFLHHAWICNFACNNNRHFLAQKPAATGSYRTFFGSSQIFDLKNHIQICNLNKNYCLMAQKPAAAGVLCYYFNHARI
jgi:hypothetical protein